MSFEIPDPWHRATPEALRGVKKAFGDDLITVNGPDGMPFTYLVVRMDFSCVPFITDQSPITFDAIFNQGLPLVWVVQPKGFRVSPQSWDDDSRNKTTIAFDPAAPARWIWYNVRGEHGTVATNCPEFHRELESFVAIAAVDNRGLFPSGVPFKVPPLWPTNSFPTVAERLEAPADAV